MRLLRKSPTTTGRYQQTNKHQSLYHCGSDRRHKPQFTYNTNRIDETAQSSCTAAGASSCPVCKVWAYPRLTRLDHSAHSGANCAAGGEVYSDACAS
jgi:hypothetical protein